MRREVGQAVCRIVREAVGPGAGWLLEAQAGQEPVVVRVGHGVARPQGRLPAVTSAQAGRPFFGQTLRVITKRRRPRRVNHVHQAVQRAEELPKSRTDPLKNQELTP